MARMVDGGGTGWESSVIITFALLTAYFIKILGIFDNPKISGLLIFDKI